MVKPRRAFHELNPTHAAELDLDIPSLGLDPQATPPAKLEGPSRAGTPGRELRALDPLSHSSQASAVPQLPIERLQAQRHTEEFRTLEHAKPPLADTRYGIVDQGIADPHTLRLSMYNIPASKALRERTQLPLCLFSRPFAAEVDSVDFSQMPDVPRCGRCMAFVNPGTLFTEGGGTFVCNLCHFPNRVPNWYYEPADHTGQRVRGPELSTGTYDLKLPPKYNLEGGAALDGPRYVFLVDVTRDSLNKAIPTLCGTAILEVLYAQSVLPPNARVAICSFARTMHMYRFGPQGVEMLVQPDIKDPIIPPDIFVDPYEYHEQIEELLQNLQTYFKENWEPKSCFGAAVKASLAALEGQGGRVIVAAATLPNLDPGALVRRDSRTYTTGASSQHEPEPQLFATPNKFYRDLSEDFAAQGAACDLFIFPTGYSDLPTLSLMSKHSGGRLYSYPRYVAQRDARAFTADLVEVCKNAPMRHCLVKVRTSLGLQAEKYWGVKEAETTGVMDQESCFMVEMGYDGTLDPRMDAYFQVAVMYTHLDGSRHLRVANIPAGITDQFKNVLKFVDSDACIGGVARQALSQLGTVSLEEIRKGITQKVYDVFGACRAYAGGALPPSQLLMPTSLRCFLPYANALIKSIALTEKSFSVDSRYTLAHQLSTAHADALALLLYPRVYCLESLIMYEGEDLEELGMLDAGIEELSTCCLIFNGRVITLWIAAGINGELLRDLFGVAELDQISAYWDELPCLETEVNKKARELIEWLCARAGRAWLPLQIARQELDGAEYAVSAQLVDDPQGVLPPYKIFLSNVHTHAKKEAYRLEHGRNWL